MATSYSFQLHFKAGDVSHRYRRGSFATLDIGDTNIHFGDDDTAKVDAVIAELVALRAEMAPPAGGKDEPASLVDTIVVDAHDDSPCPVTGKVVGQVDEDTVEVLWGERQFEENPGQGTYEPIDALRPALRQVSA
jgi:hypothetical protein